MPVQCTLLISDIIAAGVVALEGSFLEMNQGNVLLQVDLIGESRAAFGIVANPRFLP